MGKNSRLSRDQKRKAKLVRRRSNAPQSLAYTGNKYKTDALTPVVFRTELALHEADVMFERRLTDRHIQTALETLVRQLRAGPLPPLDETQPAEAGPGGEADFIIWNIRRNWKVAFAAEVPHPGKDNLIGILRTLLNSVDVWGSPSPQSRGYLAFVEGFLKKAGASVQAYTAQRGELVPVAEEEDGLLELGRDWCDNDDETAKGEFRDAVQDMIEAGEMERVVDVCQQLIGEYADTTHVPALSTLSIQAQQAMKALPGS